MDKRNIE